MSGDERRRALLSVLRTTETAAILIRNVDRAPVAADLVVYAIDLIDPIGYMVGQAMHKRGSAPAPATVIRRAHSYTSPRGAIVSGIVRAAVLAEIIDRILPEPGDLAARIREPAQPFHVRAVIVAGVGAELAQVPDTAGQLNL